MTQINNYSFNKLALVVSSSMLLLACSGARDDFTVRNSGSGNIQSCKGECVNIEFTNEPIKNLNYTCGEQVRDVTGQNSQAFCPNESELSFFIQSKTGARKVELGATTVTALNKSSVSSGLVRKNPLNLVTTDEVDNLDNVAGTTAVNIIRFLDAFRTRTIDGKEVKVDYNAYAPVNLTEIKETFKENMDEHLTEDVTLDDFATGAFISKTKAWLDSHGLAVTMSKADAQEQLVKTLRVNFASVYFQPSLAVSPLDNVETNINSFLQGLGIYGQTTDDSVVNMTVYGVTTRDGGNIGQGLYWQAPKNNSGSTSQQQFRVFYSEPFQKMRKLNPEQTGFNIFNHKVNDFKWQLINADSETSSDSVIDFNQGQFQRNFVILGNQSLKNIYLGEGTVGDEVLGQWQRTDAGSKVADGSATITKLVKETSVSSFFDPQVWRSEHVVNMGEKYVFPLHAVLEFNYGKGDSKCGATGCEFTNGSKLGITILESGDIITDGSTTADAAFVMGKPDCQASKVTGGIYTNDNTAFAEKRIGTVRATSQTVGSGTGSFVNPSIMLSGSDFKELDGIQVGTRALLENPVTINVEPLIQASLSNADSLGTPSINNIIISDDSASLSEATWANVYTNYEAIRLKNDDITDTTEDELVALKATGNVSFALSDCYSLQTRK